MIVRESTFPEGKIERHFGAPSKIVIDKQTRVAKRVYIAIMNKESPYKYYRMSFIIVDGNVIYLTGRYDCCL